MTHVNPSLDQAAFRGRNDDGSETAATWIATANTNWTQAVDTPFRIRFVVAETAGGTENNVNLQLQYNLNGAGWISVNATSSVVQSVLSTHFADDDNTTQQLGTGTFITPNSGMDEDNGLAGESGDIDFAGNDEVEVEYCCQILSADVADTDTVQLRVVRGDLTVLETYTNTPTVTVSEAGASATAGRISWTETEVPFVATAGRIAWTETEFPLAATAGRISWTESEFPLALTAGRVSHAEAETPAVATKGLISWAEKEFPFVGTKGRMSWAEAEFPIALTKGQISQTELEAPSLTDDPTAGRISHAEAEAPFVGTKGQVAWTELESPLAPTRGRIAWAEKECPIALTSGRIAWAEVEFPALTDDPTAGRISQTELETPALAVIGRISFTELEVSEESTIGGLTVISSGSLTAAGTDEFVVAPTFSIRQQNKRAIYVRDDGDATGVVDIESSPDEGTTWFTKAAAVGFGSITEFNIYPGEKHRINLSGGTSPALSYWVF